MPRSVTPWDDPDTFWDDPNVPWDGVVIPDKGAVKLVSSNHTSRVALTPVEDDTTIVVNTDTEI